MSPPIVAAVVAAGLLGVGFVLRERRTPSPMVDLSLFARARFSAGVSSAFAAFVVLFGVLVVTPFYFERAAGYGAVRTGLELMAMPVALGVTAPFAGRLADRCGVRVPAVAGLVVAAAGLVGLGWLRPAPAGFVGLLVTVGVGLGLFVSPNNAGIMAAVPSEQSGLASGLLNMSRGLGTAMGLAVATAVFAALGGDGTSVAAIRRAFSVTVLVLAGVAVVAAVVSARWSTGGPLGGPASEVSENRVGDVGLLEAGHLVV
jgi:MFS family permease